MAIDWTSRERVDSLTLELLDPWSLEHRAWLSGMTGGTLTLGYYTDVRVSGSVTAIGDEWVENSLVRIWHSVSGSGYRVPLATCFVSDIQTDGDESTYELQGMLWRVTGDKWARTHCIAKGDTSKSVVSGILTDAGASFDLSGMGDSTYSQAAAYDVGEDVSTTLFDAVSKAGGRLDTDGYGTISASVYVEPTSRSVVGSIPASMVCGDPQSSTDDYDIPNYVIVTSGSGGDRVVGTAQLDESSRWSRSRRGRWTVKTYSVDGLDSSADCRAYAKTLLDYGSGYEWDVDMRYMPINPGDVYSIEGIGSRLMLKTRDITLEPGLPCHDCWKEV